jgi:hypothetical protein
MMTCKFPAMQGFIWGCDDIYEQVFEIIGTFWPSVEGCENRGGGKG